MKRLLFTLLIYAILSTYSWADSIFVVSDISYRKIDQTSVMVCSNSNSSLQHSFKDSILSIPASVAYEGETYNVKSICNGAFANNSGIKGIIIENGIEEIQSSAFEACANLEKISIPSSVKLIGENVFSFCLNLSTIVVDKDNEIYDSRDNSNAIIRKRDKTLLYGCKNTKIPSSVECIGELAFYGCTLESIIIPDGVKRIKNYAFCECPFLTSLHLSSTVEQVDNPAFYNCANISSISVDKNNPTFDSRNNCNAIIDKDAEELVLGCCSTNIPSSISEIGEYAFSGSNIQSIVIPDGIMTIKDNAFFRCVALKQISLPSSLRYFEGHTHFGYCTSLDSVIIPQNVIDLPNDIFIGCTSLQTLIVDPQNTVYDSRRNCNAIVQTKNDDLVVGCKGTIIIDGIKYISEYAFAKSGITSIHIPSSVTDIDSLAFYSCNMCKTITIDTNNKHYKSGGTNAIMGKEKEKGKLILACSTSTICKEVKKIGPYAFVNTNDILILPQGIEDIEAYAFVNCKDLCSIFIPKSVHCIGKHAFAGCKLLSNAIITGTDVRVDKTAFEGCPISEKKWNKFNVAE